MAITFFRGSQWRLVLRFFFDLLTLDSNALHEGVISRLRILVELYLFALFFLFDFGVTGSKLAWMFIVCWPMFSEEPWD